MDYTRKSVQILDAKLKQANDENMRLSEENARLRHKLNRLTYDQNTKAPSFIDAKIKAFDLEKERDQMFENLERLKKKYNKLHDAYLEKVKRCAAFEDMFKRQKTLTGLVMKSAIEQRQKEQEVAIAKRLSTVESENLEAKVTKLQTALDEAYDIIDELEFELESVDYLEMENQRLKNELSSLKATQNRMSLPAATFHNITIDATDGQVQNNPDGGEVNDDGDDDEAPPRYDSNDYDGAANRYLMRHAVASSGCESCFNDDADNATMERSALANSTVIRGAEAESNCLRRELLRCRLQNTVRPKVVDT